MVARHFGQSRSPSAAPRLWTVEPPRMATAVPVRRKGDIQIVAVAYKVPSNLHIDSDAIGFSSFILGQVPTGRLHKAIVETGKASQVFGYPLMGVDPGIQIFGAVVKRGDPVEPVRDEIVKIVEAFAANPPDEQEMSRTKQAFSTPRKGARQPRGDDRVQMSEYIALGDWRLFFLARDDIEKITSAQVADAGKVFPARQPHHGPLPSLRTSRSAPRSRPHPRCRR